MLEELEKRKKEQLEEAAKREVNETDVTKASLQKNT